MPLIYSSWLLERKKHCHLIRHTPLKHLFPQHLWYCLEFSTLYPGKSGPKGWGLGQVGEPRDLGTERSDTYPQATMRSSIAGRSQTKARADHPPESSSKEARSEDQSVRVKPREPNKIQGPKRPVGRDTPRTLCLCAGCCCAFLYTGCQQLQLWRELRKSPTSQGHFSLNK